ncbi:purine nucleoside phosphorylase-like [Teleopsis dalmanni]|uniref:purine nucleoside phosphorylase-like n=1 Tax=Teleopsis dalmanni TaxID=139649 RepID=UPI0018CE20C0|nr:purine nucleoside phosphorylase-like [Teleopsis dalmanni]
MQKMCFLSYTNYLILRNIKLSISLCKKFICTICQYNKMKETADFLKSQTDIRPIVGIICGSGLNKMADVLTNTKIFEYRKIPHFPITNVEGHYGRLVFGYIKKIPTLAMQGRTHYYEGYSLLRCTFPIRVMKLIGVDILIVTNAAGGVNMTYNIGDIMLFRDHINFMALCGNSPLNGTNLAEFGPRFPPMATAYDEQLRKTALKVADEMEMNNYFRVGTYACLSGPNYETIAEQRILRKLGIDAIGMSTSHEVIVARHCNMRVMGFSLITTTGIDQYDLKDMLNHTEVIEMSKKREKICTKFVRNFILKTVCPTE